jgi:CheY-like chemotaxis protein
VPASAPRRGLRFAESIPYSRFHLPARCDIPRQLDAFRPPTFPIAPPSNPHLYSDVRETYGEVVNSPAPGQDPPDHAGKILIVDDNENVTRALVGLVERAGYSGVGCHSGSDALAYAEAQPPAAAVVDIHLPDISGLIVAQKLRERLGPAMPIIVVSGDTSMETLNSLSHVGVTYFLSKPLSTSLLLQHLHQLLREQ